ncbi:hypothetical protein QBC34DRAFT_391027 [Podospora aff. communis PSN243]|uniref:F-box domain-containing protein n=1 Tax=Podospora aff. communis PSN243 TaxID=3040156 RepID=A0AAV9H4S6_9PEZI|nr:hypothetical protein QBC34DRAFT_391027 [Podospora aff. communis PSN243]
MTKRKTPATTTSTSKKPRVTMDQSQMVVLPNELLLMVIEAAYEPALVWEAAEPADPDPSKIRLVLKTIYNLCLVSRWFRSAAQPIMYREFSFGYGQNWQPAPWRSWNGRLASFITTLAARPDLAAQMKRAFIHRSLADAVTDDEYASAVECAKRALDITSPMAERLLLFRSDRLYFLTFSLMPNLEHLSMQPPCSRANNFAMANWMTLDLGPKTGFLKLRSAELISFGSAWSFPPFPSLSPRTWVLPTLTLRGGFFAPIILEAVVGVETLRIVESRVSPEAINKLLSPPAAEGSQSLVGTLNGFYFASTPEEDVYTFNHDTHFTIRQLLAALYAHRRTLHHLHVDMSQVGLYGHDTGVSTLEKFASLQSLALSPGCIDRSHSTPEEWLPRLLPPTLKSLSILRDWFLLPASALLGLRDAIHSGGFPQLKRVRYSASTFNHFKSGVQGVSPETQEFLKEEFSKVGVECGIIDEQNPRWLQLRLDKIWADLERGPDLPPIEDNDDDL